MPDPILAAVPECLPGQPTDAPPGSERKIRVLIERAARHEALFHPLDGLRKTRDARPFWAQRLESRREPDETPPPIPCLPPDVAAGTLNFHPPGQTDGADAPREFAGQVWDEAG